MPELFVIRIFGREANEDKNTIHSENQTETEKEGSGDNNAIDQRFVFGELGMDAGHCFGIGIQKLLGSGNGLGHALRGIIDSLDILLNELPEVDHILAVIAEIFFQDSGHIGDFFTELVEGFRLFGEGLRGQFRSFQS